MLLPKDMLQFYRTNVFLKICDKHWKGIMSWYHTMHLLMIDMSKAFDTVDSPLLLEDLKAILNPGELHLVKVLFTAKLIVWWETEKSDFFNTHAWYGLSTSQFTLYLAGALYKENNDHICKKSTITTSSDLSSISKQGDREARNEHFAINLENGDYISAITNDKNEIDHIKKAAC